MSNLARRGFLGTLFGAASAAVLAPEELLWKPKNYVSGVSFDLQGMDFVRFNDMYLKEALRTLANQIEVNVANHYAAYGGRPWKTGGTIRVKCPARFRG